MKIIVRRNYYLIEKLFSCEVSSGMKERFVVNVNTVVTRDDKVLLVKQGRGYWMGKWIPPGGSLKTGETLEECGARETREETRVNVEIDGLVGAYSSYDPWSAFEPQVVLISFKANAISGEAHPGDDAAAVGWFAADEIKDMYKRRFIPKLIMQILHDAGFLS